MGSMSFVLTIIKRFFNERFHDQSAQLAYFFMLSIFPFLIFVISLLSYFPIYSSDILAIMKQFSPKGSYSIIESNLRLILDQQQTKLASLSLIASFWISSMAVQSLVRAMNDAYGIVRKEGFFLALGKDFILTIILIITLTTSLLVPIGEEIGRKLVAEHIQMSTLFHISWFIIKWGIGSLYLFFVFFLLYKYVPSSKLYTSAVLPGTLFTTICWQLVSVGFSYYVSFASYSQIYGRLGGFIVLLVWFYLTAAVVLIGALVNSSFFRKKTDYEKEVQS